MFAAAYTTKQAQRLSHLYTRFAAYAAAAYVFHFLDGTLVTSSLAPMLLLTASMVFPMSMMAALHIRLKHQLSCKQRVNRFICTAGHAAVKLNACFCKSSLCACANPAADQCVHIHCRQHPSQGAVAASLRICNLCVCDLSVCDFINLKLLCVPKMLKYISIFISNCYLFYCCSLSIRSFVLAARFLTVIISAAASLRRADYLIVSPKLVKCKMHLSAITTLLPYRHAPF